MKNIVIIGAGGHSAVIIDIIENMIDSGYEIQIKGLLDDNLDRKEFMKYKVLDKVENANLYNTENTEYVIAIGSNNIRNKIAEQYKNLKYFTAIHQTATISKNVYINEGTVIMPRAVINSNSEIGSHVIINTGAIIEHDSKIGDFAHISPGATLCGGVEVGEKVHIGANATIIQYKKIGAKTTIGAGSTVIKDICTDVVAVGSPARIIK
ncbi:acetyltransferase [Paraclostridium bifermentans]|uniref:acetyltransferase n=1 Tax=Paraclostridium bifermentans TaxID=1490 RepID=UPI00359C27B1